MDARQAILDRKTVHRYSTEPVPEGCIERALEAAITAPNHKLTYPWRFIRVGQEARQRLTELYVEGKRQKKGGLTDDQEEAYRQKVANPPELVVPVQELDEDDFRRKEDYATMACAIQNFMVSLRGEGVFSKWTTGSVTRHQETYELLGVDPDAQEIVGFLWVGYPAEESRGDESPPRRPLDEVVRRVP
jgi:nitroreductase